MFIFKTSFAKSSSSCDEDFAKIHIRVHLSIIRLWFYRESLSSLWQVHYTQEYNLLLFQSESHSQERACLVMQEKSSRALVDWFL